MQTSPATPQTLDEAVQALSAKYAAAADAGTINPLADVSSRYGAPMGRTSYGTAPATKVRLFTIRLDSGGYDKGGAYWGHGAPMYCATDGASYVAYTRANSRAAAALALGLLPAQLARAIN